METNTRVQLIVMTQSSPWPSSSIFELISRLQLNSKKWKEARGGRGGSDPVCTRVIIKAGGTWLRSQLGTIHSINSVMSMWTHQSWGDCLFAQRCSSLLFPVLQVTQYLHNQSCRFKFGLKLHLGNSALQAPDPNVGLLSALTRSN